MIWRASWVMGVLVLAAAGEEPAGDLKKMQGKWEAAEYVADGKSWSKKERAGIHLTVKGAGGTFQVGKRILHGTYALDEKARPRTLDITLTSGADRGKKKLAIYEVKGDVMRICVAPVGGKRPTEFASKAGSGVVLEKWERVAARE